MLSFKFRVAKYVAHVKSAKHNIELSPLRVMLRVVVIRTKFVDLQPKLNAQQFIYIKCCCS